MIRRSFFKTLLAPVIARFLPKPKFKSGIEIARRYEYIDRISGNNITPDTPWVIIQQEMTLEEFCRRYPPSQEKLDRLMAKIGKQAEADLKFLEGTRWA